jgi:hypothetical protein
LDLEPVISILTLYVPETHLLVIPPCRPSRGPPIKNVYAFLVCRAYRGLFQTDKMALWVTKLFDIGSVRVCVKEIKREREANLQMAYS